MSRLPPLRLLTTFEAVARLGSMREAASALNVTQPAVTQALKALEDHVGAVLIDRTTRPARLTEPGQQLARATRDGLDLIAATIEEIRSSTGLVDQRLTVACTMGFATHWLMPRLSDFYARNPGLFVNVQVPPTDLPQIWPGTDLVLRYGRGTWTDGETLRLFSEVVCPVGHPALVENLLAKGAGLETAPLIHVRTVEARHWEGWSDYFAGRGLPKPRGQSHVFDNYVQAVQAALDSRGLMLGWRSITEKLVADGSLEPWPDAALDLGTAYFATVAPAAAKRPAVRAFVAWLGEKTEAESLDR
ncbi:LysR family transcriptional regulator [Agrobacterium albertimagni AOL15]|uniref:LysR family transcriptional regulator n=1 Tax=Agrobacterium albertimagni AOL15 TaxID=1156935 RepID=K2Q8S4_9HYPH|nr:LysR substrate-binding domain-containing protein [Agrobacterium albertimagni]EKF57316.1 LysR family transcriptional regulator [Agrobacterium albertimagni AOL15]